uniref:G_PROTEIN_RECEP_F1_2 domain-containing protein n=1 Tax=Caenorhabditis tropicalis TaxID=1561998 RepID=A0A1I7UK85_9PELO
MMFCGLMICLGLLIYSKLSEYRSFRSDRMIRLQKQLWIALIVQTGNPIIFMYFPILLMYILPMFRIGFGPLSNLSMIAFSIYPPLDQLIIVYIIRDFRDYVKEVFCGFIHRIRKQNNQNNHTNSTELEIL